MKTYERTASVCTCTCANTYLLQAVVRTDKGQTTVRRVSLPGGDDVSAAEIQLLLKPYRCCTC